MIGPAKLLGDFTLCSESAWLSSGFKAAVRGERRTRGAISTWWCSSAICRRHLACGFIGSPDVLASWPRHELFQFVNDTRSVHGSLDGIVSTAFTREDARQAARIGASGVYHGACHSYVFDGEAADAILGALFKGSFFTLQALHFARTGSYPCDKASLAPLLEGDEARILDIARTWESHRPQTDDERLALVDLLLRWSGAIISESC